MRAVFIYGWMRLHEDSMRIRRRTQIPAQTKKGAVFFVFGPRLRKNNKEIVSEYHHENCCVCCRSEFGAFGRIR
jgi:hypothetical protein